MTKPLTNAAGVVPGSKKNHPLIMIWILAWTASMVMADKAELFQWHNSQLLSIAPIVVNAAMGLGVIVTYMRFLGELDEMQQKIQLNALSLAMGVGLVGSFSYSLKIKAGFFDNPNILLVVMLMSGTYGLSIIVSKVRYR